MLVIRTEARLTEKITSLLYVSLLYGLLCHYFEMLSHYSKTVGHHFEIVGHYFEIVGRYLEIVRSSTI